MARLSVFHDGFTRDTAVAVLGADGADLVETLAEQSLRDRRRGRRRDAVPDAGDGA